jgi:hypothetical protein
MLDPPARRRGALQEAARYALLGLLIAAMQGCLYEAVLDANGGGVMTVTLRFAKREELPSVKAQLESRAVMVTNAEFVSNGDAGQGVFKLKFDDVTKLSTSSFFKAVSITRSEGQDGTKVLTAVAKNENPTEVPDSVVQRLGPEVKVVVTFPGAIVESNGTVSGGNTVTWTWSTKEYFKLAEVMMTAAYRPAAVTPGGTPGTPGTTPGGGKAGG